MDTRVILNELRSERDRIGQAITALEALDNGTKLHPAKGSSLNFGANKPTKRGRHISAAGRARIAAAARERWAKLKGKAAASAPAKPKRRISAAGKARIVAAAKKRWAAFRTAKAGKR